MGNLGQRSKQGTVDQDNPFLSGGWAVSFSPADLTIQTQFEVYHVAISGPSGSRFQVFIDTTFYDYVARGDINSWDPSQPMHVRPGQTIHFYWNTSAGTAPRVSIFCREPSPV